MSNFIPDSATLPNNEGSDLDARIRRIWHNDAWYYSIIDVVSWATNRDYDAARKYWKNLKAELKQVGSEVVSVAYQLKLTAADGKQRLTDVAPAEQILRIVQEIPGAKTNEIKDWLARVGNERLQEEEDPEEGVIQAFNRAEDKYRRLGRTESWIEARMQGIITRKQFIEALKAAIMDVPITLYAQATEKVYKGLWQRTTAQLRGDLQLKPQQNIRDHFGEFALIYTGLAERVAAKKLGDMEIVPIALTMDIVHTSAKLISKQAKATSKELGIDLVTERPLLARGK